MRVKMSKEKFFALTFIAAFIMTSNATGNSGSSKAVCELMLGANEAAKKAAS
jgi:hypothetical protein